MAHGHAGLRQSAFSDRQSAVSSQQSAVSSQQSAVEGTAGGRAERSGGCRWILARRKPASTGASATRWAVVLSAAFRRLRLIVPLVNTRRQAGWPDATGFSRAGVRQSQAHRPSPAAGVSADISFRLARGYFHPHARRKHDRQDGCPGCWLHSRPVSGPPAANH